MTTSPPGVHRAASTGLPRPTTVPAAGGRRVSPRPVAVLIALSAAIAGCSPRDAIRSPGEDAATVGTVTLLAINDVYRIEGVDGGTVGGLARVRSLRQDLERDHPELLLLHAGDFLYPSLLSDTYDGAQMVDLMNRLDGDPGGFDARMVVTFGNHEFEKQRLAQASLLEERIRESQFTWLGSDLEWATGEDGAAAVEAPNLVRSTTIESNGLRVGIFSVSTDERHPEYVERFSDRALVTRRLSQALRDAGADLVIALTHLPAPEDLALMEATALDGPDLVIGGHEHARTAEQSTDGRWLLKADADARSATLVRLTLRADGSVDTLHEFLDLGPAVEPDADAAQRTRWWLDRHQAEYCAERDEGAGCLDVVVGTTSVRLLAEENHIRRFETNLGNWVADRARELFPDAEVALINAGSLRLNQDIPAGPIRVRVLEELFAYPNKLVALTVDAATLRAALLRSVENWTGSGAFLQVSGIAFRFDPQATGDQRVRDITLLDRGAPLREGDEVTVVTWDFLHGGGDDYTMWTEIAPRTLDLDFAQHIRQLLESQDEPIAPTVEGRICNLSEATALEPCLAMPRDQR
ncbi:MAG: bifunctional metallophosphatase/5'-nucleotidase [Acidobacteria bacterium]|nr:MAG: bifunctional metallophosphatase/5'-nucleotidase [Acidobacteriota bacterium]REK00997.1 MAG: bifunctional metallophosphatase/5'-nucleotidase [Acidobacteriota bacterium]